MLGSSEVLYSPIGFYHDHIHVHIGILSSVHIDVIAERKKKNEVR